MKRLFSVEEALDEIMRPRTPTESVDVSQESETSTPSSMKDQNVTDKA